MSLVDELINEGNIQVLKNEWCRIGIQDQYGQMTDIEYIAMRLKQQFRERVEAQIKKMTEIDTNESTMLTSRGSINALRWIIGENKS